jgi:hypothetical protein
MGGGYRSSVGWAGEGYRRYGERYGRGPDYEYSEPSRFGETYGGPARTRGRFTGRGPKGYGRSDARIREDVSDRLELHGEIDASEIEVRVESGEVTLEGTVSDRLTRRLAEDIVEDSPGVKQVHNRIRVQSETAQSISGATTGTRTTTRRSTTNPATRI